MSGNLNIIIQDWAGNTLYKGNYASPEVDEVLDLNRCNKCPSDDIKDSCKTCDGSGYWGDFEVYWECERRNENLNVYEFINY